MPLITRSRVFRLLRWLRGGRARPISRNDVRSILVFQHERIGDYLVATPMYRWLSEHCPGAEIDVISSNLNTPLIAMDPHINSWYEVNSRQGWHRDLFGAIRYLRKKRYDLILVTTFTDRTRNAVLCVTAKGRPWCATFSDADRADQYAQFFDSVTIRERMKEHVGSSIIRTAMEALGDRTQPGLRPYVIKRGTPAPYIAINVETRDPKRNWDPVDASWVGNQLKERHPDLSVVSGWQGTLEEMVDFYGNARLVITANSAPAHVASAAGVPVVVLYDTVENASEWYPLGQEPHRCLLPEEGTAVSGIRKERVLEAALALIGGTEIRA